MCELPPFNDYEIHIISANNADQQQPLIIPVHKFFLSQRSLFFRAALEFPQVEGENKPYLEMVNTFKLSTLQAVLTALQTGQLDWKTADFFDVYKLADFWQCADLKSVLEEDEYPKLLQDAEYCQTLVKESLDYDFNGLKRPEYFKICFKLWVTNDEIIDLMSADLLEKILLVSKFRLSIPKKAKWGAYRVVDKIITEKYTNAIALSQDTVDSFYISILPEYQGTVDEVECDADMVFKSERTKVLWSKIPWKLFTSLELERILESNPSAPREILESFIPLNQEVSDKCKAIASPYTVDIDINTQINFVGWYDATYSDLVVQFIKGRDSFPAHKCIVSKFPSLWDSELENGPMGKKLMITEPEYFYKRSDKLSQMFLRVVYEELDFIDVEDDDEKLLNLLCLTHHHKLVKASDYISRQMVKNEASMWRIFFNLTQKFHYFLELFPTFPQSLDNAKLLKHKPRLVRVDCPATRLAWVNLLVAASLSKEEYNEWGEICMNGWFEAWSVHDSLDTFHVLLLTLLNAEQS